MISHLKLQDLILIEKAEIEFGSGLNIFTGETGSGKSAILTAIRLISGERTDTEWIRAGASMAVAEAKLSVYSKELLGEIDPPPSGEPLTVRREIHRSGKSRCFIEDHLVNASVLRDLMRPLIEMVDQSSSAELILPEKQRKILDTYAGIEKELSKLKFAYEEMTLAKKELDLSLVQEETRERNLERIRSILQEIEEVNWQKEEEESLTQAHLLLTHAQELTEKTSNAAEGLSSLAPHLRQISHFVESAVALDPQLSPSAQAIKTAVLELDETEHCLRSYASRLEADPARLEIIEKRIGAIETLKRRLGPTWEDVEKQKEKYSKELEKLECLDDRRNALADQLKKLEEETQTLAKLVSEKRSVSAKELSRAILEELRCLNLPHAALEITLLPKPISSNGIDEIRFFFTANPGLHPLPLEECASGGELSRLLFATKVVLAEKESTQSLIFDEIDSNVGGQTAAVLGDKLKELSQKRQVICVTHFVQVARCALHHFAVAKREQGGRAATFVERLAQLERQREYARMIGN